MHDGLSFDDKLCLWGGGRNKEMPFYSKKMLSKCCVCNAGIFRWSVVALLQTLGDVPRREQEVCDVGV